MSEQPQIEVYKKRRQFKNLNLIKRYRGSNINLKKNKCYIYSQCSGPH